MRTAIAAALVPVWGILFFVCGPLSAQSEAGSGGERSGVLAKELYESLVRYHNTDGQGNGSTHEGIQYPPDLTDPSPRKLEAYLRGLVAHVSKAPGIDVDVPPPPPERAKYRKKIAEKAAPWVKANGPQMLEAAVSAIVDPEIEAYVRKALKAVPRPFFTDPSSSSGTHHPADEINVGGLVLHSCRNTVVGDILCDLYKVSSADRDLVRAASILHDTWKGGDPWTGYAKDHGPIAQRRLAELVPVSDPRFVTIRRLVANHMAQWNKPTATEPADLLEQIVSYADYLGSQDSVYVRVPGDGVD